MADDGFWELPASLMTALATVVGFAMVGGLNADKQAVLGNFLMLIGQLLSTNSTQAQVLNVKDADAKLEELKAQLMRLEARINAMAVAPPPPQAGGYRGF